MVDKSIKNMLLKFSPKEIQEAVKSEDYELPDLHTASLFERITLVTLPMVNGASAAKFAYILEHTNHTVADRYIAATPEMADIREQGSWSEISVQEHDDADVDWKPDSTALNGKVEGLQRHQTESSSPCWWL